MKLYILYKTNWKIHEIPNKLPVKFVNHDLNKNCQSGL